MFRCGLYQSIGLIDESTNPNSRTYEGKIGECAMHSELVLFDLNDGVVTVTLNRPEVVNALNGELVEALVDTFDRISKDSSIRCVVVQGAGRGFCSGADLRERSVSTPREIRNHRDLLVKCVMHMQEMPIPVIASCHGGVVAGGMEFALSCDIRVGCPGSLWGLTEVRNAGAFPGVLGPVRLEKISSGLARLLVFTGKLVPGEEAYRMGLIDVFCEDSERIAVTKELASTITKNSRAGLASAKRLMVRSGESPLEVAAELSRALRCQLDGSADAQEGVVAWLEGREPSFEE